MSNKYIIGIDGGGTKTLGVLWDASNKEIKRVENGFANFNVNYEVSKANIEKTIGDLLIENSNTNIIIGVSGYSGLKDPNQYEKELSEKFNTKVTLKDDGYLALNSVDNENNLPVILVIGGTGSIVYGLKNNKTYRYGGHGHLLGDEGSGYNLVIEAFKFIIKENDDNKRQSNFTKEILNSLNFSTINEIKQYVYSESKNNIASHTRIINKLVKNNNKTAIKLVTKEAKKLSKQVKSIVKKMKINDMFILALRGGFIKNSHMFSKVLITELEKSKIDFKLDTSNNEPVLGALNVKGEER